MRIPNIRGVIDRRILVNFRVDAEVMAGVVPPPFRPKLVGGYAVGGICLIRLRGLRPKSLPVSWGLRSENAAHRIAVEWGDSGRVQEGVYIPRRDTDSVLNVLAGGRVFPGEHHAATFEVNEDPTKGFFSVAATSRDQEMRVRVAGNIESHFPTSSVFSGLEEASAFFERGSLGYSATRDAGRYDGLELRCASWHVDPLAVTEVESSYFFDPDRFPPGTVAFDNALLMRGIQHEWRGREDLCETQPRR